MHIIAYLFGLTYYIAMPFTLLPPSAFQYEAMRGAWTSAVQSLPAPMADFLSGSSNVSTTVANATGAAGQPEAMNATESMNAALTSSEGLGMDMRVFEALHQRPEQEAWRLWVVSAAAGACCLKQFISERNHHMDACAGASIFIYGTVVQNYCIHAGCIRAILHAKRPHAYPISSSSNDNR